MPSPRQVRSAQRSYAQCLASNKGAPEGLSTFLGGFAVSPECGSGAAQEQEGVISMNLRLLNKSSDTTKQKALLELLRHAEEAPSAVLIRFVSSISEAVIRHMQHNSPAIRVSVFALLKILMGRGKDVKVAFVPDLPVLSAIWVMAMNDMEAAVRAEAREAFETAFSAEKRPAMLLKYKDDILSGLIGTVKDIVETDAKPLQDDVLDGRSNLLFAALRGMGYMIRQVSAAQVTVVAFVVDGPIFVRVLPRRTADKNYIASRTPLVRSSALSLLRDIVAVCPCTAKLHQLVAQAVHSSILSTEPPVVARVWELLLFWCRTNVAELVSSLPKGFLDDVVDSFMECARPDLADVIFPSLLPLLVQLSKDSRCGDLLDEFGGALVEKLRRLKDTPNVSAHELELVLHALMECWELLCLRKKGSNAVAECEGVFALILQCLCELLQPDSKRKHYSGVAVACLGRSLLKTSVRNEALFSNCMDALCGVALPSSTRAEGAGLLSLDADRDLVKSYCYLRCAATGFLYALAMRDSSYVRQAPLIRTYVDSIVTQLLLPPSDTVGLAAILSAAGEAGYCPSNEAARGIVDHLLGVMHALKQREEADALMGCLSVEESEEAALCKTLLDLALSWNDFDCTRRLDEVSRSLMMERVQRAVRDHWLRDPQKAFELLISSCEISAFDDIDSCLIQISAMDLSCTEGQCTAIVEAVATALEAILRRVNGVKDIFHTDDEDCSCSVSKKNTMGKPPHPCNLERHRDPNTLDGLNACNNPSVEATGDTNSSTSDEGAVDVDSADMSVSSLAEKISRSGKESARAPNEGADVLYSVAKWCSLLQPGGDAVARGRTTIGSLICLSADLFAQRLARFFYYIVAALAPRLYAEHYISTKASRLVAQDDDGELAAALEGKTHFLRSDDFRILVDHVTTLLDNLGVPQSCRDDWAWNFMASFLKDQTATCFKAVHQLQFILPFASEALLQRVVQLPSLWGAYEVLRVGGADAKVQSDLFLFFSGYYSLEEMSVSLIAVVRTGQVLRLMDYCNLAERLQEAGTAVDAAAKVFLYLLKAASAKEAFSSATQAVLFFRLLPRVFLCIDSAPKATALAELLLSDILPSAEGGDDDEAQDHFMCTFGAALRDVASAIDATEHENVVMRARRVMSAVTERVVQVLFTSNGARGISHIRAALYTTFYALMDEVADVVRDNILAQLPQDLTALFLEASCMLPSWDLETAKLSLVVHRHLASMPVVVESTAKSLLEYAQKQSSLECLELLAELSCTRILNSTVFSDLARVLTHSLCRCYTLRHLPTNGRLSQAGFDHQEPPVSFDRLRRISVAAVLARRGVAIHACTEDVLRSTVNFVLFDTVCEAVARLRVTTEEEMPLLAKLIAFTSDFMRSLLSSDTALLRASEASVNVIASALAYIYLWLSATPIARLEAMGTDVVPEVLCSVCLLSNLTLVRAAAPLHEKMRLVLNKGPLKPLRDDFSSVRPLKLALLRRHNSLIAKTHKQKLLLFPYLLAWCVLLTTPATEDETARMSDSQGYKQWQTELNNLLDLLCTLLLTSRDGKGKQIADTYLGASSAGGVSSGTAKNAEAGEFGFEVVALTCISLQPMAQLARGAASVFALLLRGPTLSFVKNWLDTIERKVQAMIYNFVERYISPLLIQENLMLVHTHSPDGGYTFTIGENYSVHVSFSQHAIDLSYSIDDTRVAVRIFFPASYPLRQPMVEFTSGRECGVSTEKWRMWMLKMTSMLFGGSASVWECLELFRQNLEAHFGGQEPCPICYAVVSAVNHKLPVLRCAVCRNSLFHSSCLYTWWAHSEQIVCPLCRSPWT